MKKIFVALALMSLFGCASKGDLATLTTRVEQLEATDKNTALAQEKLLDQQTSIEANVAELNAKVDRAFAKGRK